MTPRQIRVVSNWLEGLADLRFHRKAETLDDLLELAQQVVAQMIFPGPLRLDYDPTTEFMAPPDELRAVLELIENLDLLRQRQNQPRVQKARWILKAWLAKRAHLPRQGAAQRRAQGTATDRKIEATWNCLDKAERERAAIIAGRLGLTARHVRRRLGELNLRGQISSKPVS